jgi:hypothetical protein
MYVSAAPTEASFHIWRQPYAEGALPPAEQITAGPTSEEGIAMAPDGKSLVTAVGLTQRSVWIHDARATVRFRSRVSPPVRCSAPMAGRCSI